MFGACCGQAAGGRCQSQERPWWTEAQSVHARKTQAVGVTVGEQGHPWCIRCSHCRRFCHPGCLAGHHRSRSRWRWRSRSREMSWSALGVRFRRTPAGVVCGPRRATRPRLADVGVVIKGQVGLFASYTCCRRYRPARSNLSLYIYPHCLPRHCWNGSPKIRCLPGQYDRARSRGRLPSSVPTFLVDDK